jgi:two-component system alkaline phosphatase synthesis response regulator PhoP
MPGELILIVDDEPNIVQLARIYLERDGYRVAAAGDGHSALESVSRLQPALVILDIMLPGIDGLEVCRILRAKDSPVGILMLTARDEDVDKIIGLEIGADDYLTKPFNPRELVARVKAFLRRGERRLQTAKTPRHVGKLTIDPARYEVTIDGNLVKLRHQEFNLLLILIEHKGMVLSREKLLELAWGYDYGGETRTVDVHIGHLRKKLAGSQVRIETVTSEGYKLVA